MACWACAGVDFLEECDRLDPQTSIMMFALFCGGQPDPVICPAQPSLEALEEIWKAGVVLLGYGAFVTLLTKTDVQPMQGASGGHEPEYYAVWSPTGDSGADLTVSEHGADMQDDYGLNTLRLQPGELMVDIGGNLGAVTMRAAMGSPAGLFAVTEAAPPTFLLLQINLWCNLPAAMLAGPDANVASYLAAAAGDDDESLTIQWQPYESHMSRVVTNEDSREMPSSTAVHEFVVRLLT
eukprot:SAG31_NODE_11800_length_997_cov_1.091314_1_plen_238_part_00